VRPDHTGRDERVKDTSFNQRQAVLFRHSGVLVTVATAGNYRNATISPAAAMVSSPAQS
jgi:hypothetical protein